MKTFIVCKKCKAKNSLKGNFPTRWELASEIGRQFQHKCNFCNEKSDYSVDEVSAKDSSLALIASLLVLPVIFLCIFLLWPYLKVTLKAGTGIFMAISIISLIYYMIEITERKKIKEFNKSKPDRLSSIQFKRPLK